MTGFIIFIVVMIVVSLINKAKQQSNRANRNSGKVSPRVQALVEKIQAQQGGNQPTQFQGQYTQAARQGGPPAPPQSQQSTFPSQTGSAPGSQQVAAVLEQLLQSGRQPRHLGERTSPGQAAQQPGGSAQYPSTGVYQPPAQFQPAYNANPYQPPAHRPQQSQLPVSNQDLDAQVRTLMNANNEVGAIRLLGEKRELGILEAQKYARSLVAPKTAPRSTDADESDDPDEDDGRYVGSAAFAESIFNLDDREENVWASGWVDKPEPEDRSDIDELWQTVRNTPRPGTTPS
ncbi:hypothetical protein EV645_7748 [Kribbella rubisoli]|jgi:hypothetical protein|uniref:Uncharacterized protein n=1 Tax=Kribbella rubisoli TaxID=3075929 RepID=A0A4Q7VY93_9ACTN|nr:hypothetical protein [Kribbella rubisoli]RZU01653.1 hypothetical protein EV645_7748 [Kribbella rubisoli]